MTSIVVFINLYKFRQFIFNGKTTRILNNHKKALLLLTSRSKILVRYLFVCPTNRRKILFDNIETQAFTDDYKNNFQ